MPIRVQLVVREGKGREASLRKAETQGVEVDVVSPGGEMCPRIIKTSYHATMVGLETKPELSAEERKMDSEIQSLFPFLRLSREALTGAGALALCGPMAGRQRHHGGFLGKGMPGLYLRTLRVLACPLEHLTTHNESTRKDLPHVVRVLWAAIIASLIFFAGCAGVPLCSESDSKGMPAYHPFRSEKAKAEYLALYDKRASSWPVPSECKMVNTSYGQTFVRISGPVGAPPLVLLHGGGANSLHWTPNIEALSKTYRVFAIDCIYDYGRSISSQPVRNIDDLLEWLNETFNALELGDHINLMGLSYGGWLAGQYALRFPERLDKVVLLAPAGTVLPLRVTWISRAILCTLPFRLFTRSFMCWILEDLANRDEEGRTMVEEWADFTYKAMRSFTPRNMVFPTVLSDGELQGIKVPMLFLVGEHEKMYSAQKAVDRLHRVAPRIEAEIILHAGHDLTIVQAALVHSRVLAFLNQATAHAR